ncbi:MAG: crotonase/enoyl-CoA hydratase family protein [Myxococcaceae bacterium]
MPTPTLTLETRGHLLLAGLNRPEKRNAFNLAMLKELALAYARLEDDKELRCLVLFAHGDHFTAGLDLAEVGPHVAGGGSLEVPEGIDPFGLQGRRVSKPVVLALQGYCYTVAVELALAVDVVVAARDCRFTQFEVRRGIMPFGGASLRFARVAGWGNAMRWILTGDTFDAAEAYRLGLAQEVTEPGQQLERALAIAGTIARQAPLAVQATLRNARVAMEKGHGPALEQLMAEARALMTTEDAAEGVMSFVERREAVFRGR